MSYQKVIALDFDGTLCTFDYPRIGKPHEEAINAVKREQAKGTKFVLWTNRTGKHLDEAVAACKEWGIELAAVNDSLPEWKEAYGNDPRKIGANEYWDDRAVPVTAGIVQDLGYFSSPFDNDPFALVWAAFRNLYPDKEFTAYWDTQIRDDEDGNPVYGMTDFGDDGSVAVFVKPTLAVSDAVEIFAHELAHVAVGLEHDHDDVWEAAFGAIFAEYNRVAGNLFEPDEGGGMAEA